MKRKILFILSISMLTLLFGCTDPQNVEEPNKPNVPKVPNTPGTEEEVSDISSYFPIKENTRYVYEGVGNEYASYTVDVLYTKDNKVQRRVDNGGTVVNEIIEVGKDEVVNIFSRPETYYRENFIRKDILDSKKEENREVLLKGPLEKGNSWDVNENVKRSITNISADISVLGKNYKAIEVTTDGYENKTMDYYVKDIGLVKSISIGEGMEISSTLTEIQEDYEFSQNIRFFYPNIDDGKLYHIDKDVVFKTNDISRKTLEETYKELLKQTNTSVLTENTKINSLYLSENGMVYIDLSEDFVKEMNAGSGFESMLLDSVATTFGYYYGVDKVVLTIDGGNYESGHIVLEKGDYISVDKDALLLE